MKIFGFVVERRVHAYPPQGVYTDLHRLERTQRDALRLMAHYYRGKAWSRRALQGKLSQPRWNTAYLLLKLSDVIDEKGRVLAYDYAHAEGMVQVKVAEYRHHLKSAAFTLPW